MLTRYMDGCFGMGKFAHAPDPRVDCPLSDTYVDWHFFWSPKPPGHYTMPFVCLSRTRACP